MIPAKKRCPGGGAFLYIFRIAPGAQRREQSDAETNEYSTVRRGRRGKRRAGNGGTFTHTDLKLFALDDNMKMLTAVGNNGIVYAVEKTAGFSSVKFNAYRKSVLDRHLNYLDSPVYYSKYIKDLLKGIEAYGIRYYATGT